MRKKLSLILKLALIGLLLIAFTGCTKALDQTKVDGVTENVLQSLTANDYAAFSKDFSVVLIKYFGETEFKGLKDVVAETSGKYISKTLDSIQKSQEFFVYTYNCKFEKENVKVTISFPLDAYQVDGLYFDSDGIRKAMEEKGVPTD